MKKYLGVKIISAEPMTLTDYNSKFDRVVPKTKGEDGYLVQYDDSYKSWSPKEVFEKAYHILYKNDYANIGVDLNSGNWQFIENEIQEDCRCDM